MAQQADIEGAYTLGRIAAERTDALDSNPYYKNTEEWDAWRSGWIDRTNQLKRMHK